MNEVKNLVNKIMEHFEPGRARKPAHDLLRVYQHVAEILYVCNTDIEIPLMYDNALCLSNLSVESIYTNVKNFIEYVRNNPEIALGQANIAMMEKVKVPRSGRTVYYLSDEFYPITSRITHPPSSNILPQNIPNVKGGRKLPPYLPTLPGGKGTLRCLQ